MAATYRGAMEPTQAEIQERIDMLAAGESPAAVAVRFGRAVGTIYNFQTRYKDKIADRKEELLGVVHAKTAERWINDVVKSTEVLEALAEDTIERRAEPDLPVRDVSRLNRDARRFIRDAHEVNGMLPQRVQAQVAMSHTPYCIVGFSCECGRGCDQVQQTWPWATSESETCA
jgi:hypothetical protein